MTTNKITVERCYSLGNYETIRLGIEVTVNDLALTTQKEAIDEAFEVAIGRLDSAYFNFKNKKK